MCEHIQDRENSCWILFSPRNFSFGGGLVPTNIPERLQEHMISGSLVAGGMVAEGLCVCVVLSNVVGIHTTQGQTYFLWLDLKWSLWLCSEVFPV